MHFWTNDEKNKLPRLNVFGLPPWSYFIDCLNGLQSVFSEIPIISLWPITLPFKLKGRILQHMETGNRKIDKHSIFSYPINSGLVTVVTEIQWSLIKDQVNQSYLLVSYPFHATACRPWSISPYEDSSSSWSSCGIWIYRSEISAERSPIRN